MLRILIAIVSVLLALRVANAQISIPPITVSQPSDSSVNFGDVYGAVRFEIDRLDPKSQEYWLRTLIQTIFGIKDSGEYLIALELNDDSQTGDEKLVARKVIAHFVKSPDGTMISDILGLLKGTETGSKKAQNLSLIVFSGDLIPRVPIQARSNTYSIALQVYRSHSSELTSGDLVQSVIDVINTSATALKFSPLNDSIKTVYGQMRQFGFQIYKAFADTSVLVVSETQMSFIAANQTTARPNIIRYEFPFLFDRSVNDKVCPDSSQPGSCYRNRVQIRIMFDTYRSEIGNFKGGKFAGPLNWSQWLSQGSITGKNVIQFLSERDTTKAFVSALTQGRQAFGKFAQSNDISSGCDAVISELKQYFSSADVGVLYWSFLSQYGPALSVSQDAASCQNRYSSIYFAPYGLPAVPIGQGSGGPSAQDIPKSTTAPSVPALTFAKGNFSTETRVRLMQGVFPRSAP